MRYSVISCCKESCRPKVVLEGRDVDRQQHLLSSAESEQTADEKHDHRDGPGAGTTNIEGELRNEAKLSFSRAVQPVTGHCQRAACKRLGVKHTAYVGVCLTGKPYSEAYGFNRPLFGKITVIQSLFLMIFYVGKLHLLSHISTEYCKLISNLQVGTR